MEKLAFEQYGWVGVVLFMALRLLWDILKSKNKEQVDAVKYNTQSVQELTCAIDKMKDQLAEIPKLKTDMKRSFTAHKIIAGEKWPVVRKEMMEDL